MAVMKAYTAVSIQYYRHVNGVKDDRMFKKEITVEWYSILRPDIFQNCKRSVCSSMTNLTCLLTGSVDSCKNSNCSFLGSSAQCVPTLSGHVCRCRQNPDLNFFNSTSRRCEGKCLMDVFISF